MLSGIQKFLSFFFLSVIFISGLSASDSIRTQRIAEVEVVSQSRQATEKTTAPLQVINNTDINRIGVASVSDAVRRFSGVVVKDYGGLGGMKTVSIRGMGAQHTAVSYDGLTISNVQSGQIDIGRFSLDNISEISLTIGQSDNIFQSARSFASAGVLSIETASPVFKSRPYKITTQLKTGSFGFFSPVLYYAQKINNNLSASLNGSWERTDGSYRYEIDNITQVEEGKRKNSDVDIHRLELNLYGDYGKGGQFKFKANYYDAERGLPGSVALYNPYQVERMKNKDFITQVSYKNMLSEKFSLQGQGKYSYAYYKHTDNTLKDNKVTQNEYYASASILYVPLDVLSFSLSEDFAHNTLESEYKDIHSPKRYTSQTVLAVRFRSEYLTVTGNLLATYMKQTIKEGENPKDRKKITPSVGLSYRPIRKTDMRIRASFKKIFRVATFDDMYYTQMGSKNLSPENTTQYNVGLTWSGRISRIFDQFSVSVDGYYNNVRDKIAPFPISTVFTMRNYGKVDMKGVDVNTRLNVTLSNKLNLNVSGNYSYQKVIDITDESSKSYKDQLPFTPLHSGSGAVSFENPWLNVSYTVVVSGMRYALDQNIPVNEMDSYSDHSVSANRTFIFKKDMSLRLQANLTNLGGKNYQIIPYYPMPGRAFTVSAALTY